MLFLRTSARASGAALAGSAVNWLVAQSRNPYRQTADFTDAKLWLLRFFDQLRFYPVTAAELLTFREDFPAGRVKLKVEHDTFRLRDNRFLAQDDASMSAFRATQRLAFNAEREHWAAAGLASFSSDLDTPDPAEACGTVLSAGAQGVFAEVPGNVWRIEVTNGQQVRHGQRLAILESMKTEIPVLAPCDGTITDVFCAEGRFAAAGQLMFGLQPPGGTR